MTPDELKELRDMATYDCGFEEESDLLIKFTDAYKSLQRDYSDLRNELCLACGKYKKAHLGDCNGCRWKESI
jgi:hypothetical protein